MKVQNLKFKVQNTEQIVQGSKFKIQNAEQKVQSSKLKIQDSKHRTESLKFKVQYSGSGLLCCAVILLLAFMLSSVCLAEENKESKWQGVDESVVEKYAKEHGREAKEPLINTDQGDLLLFVFLLSGTAGGFAAGYYWRVLLEQRTRERDDENIV